MSFAVIETGGKQYKVSASNILKVEKLNISKGKKVEFKKVLLVNDDKTIEVGNPTVSGAVVEGLLLDNIKDKKIIVFKKRRRQNSRKRYGHRQLLSKIQITKILSKGGKVISEIKPDKIKLSNDEKSDKKLNERKQVNKKTAIKKKQLKQKIKSKSYGNKKSWRNNQEWTR